MLSSLTLLCFGSVLDTTEEAVFAPRCMVLDTCGGQKKRSRFEDCQHEGVMGFGMHPAEVTLASNRTGLTLVAVVAAPCETFSAAACTELVILFILSFILTRDLLRNQTCAKLCFARRISRLQLGLLQGFCCEL